MLAPQWFSDHNDPFFLVSRSDSTRNTDSREVPYLSSHGSSTKHMHRDVYSRLGFYYGWIIVAVVFVTLFFALGLRYAFGVFYVAILDETGWSRAETAGIFSVAMVVYAFASLLSGALFDTLGPRRLFPIGAVFLGLGLILCARAQTITEFYIYYGLMVGVAYSFLGFITQAALVSRWFVRRRGLASAIGLSGIGIGALSMSILSEKLIAAIGWRQTFTVYGFVAMGVLIPLTLLLIRDRPQSIGLNPDGDADTRDSPDSLGTAASPSLGQAVRQPAFWFLFVSVMLLGMNNQTLVVHQTRLFIDLGFTLALSASLFGLTGLFRSLGGMIWGALSDRIGRQPCVLLAIPMALLALTALGSSRWYPHVWLLIAFVALWGLGFNGLPPLYAASVADRFQGRHLGKIFGLLDVGFGIGSALGPWLTGLLYDRIGRYDPAVWAMMVTTILSGAALWLAAPGKPPGASTRR